MFDRAIGEILLFFQNGQAFFLNLATDLATLMFIISFGFGGLKVYFGGEQVNKFLMTHFMALVTYFLFLWLFPIGLPWLSGLMHDWGYGAMFQNGIVVEVDSERGTEEEFYEWLVEKGSFNGGESIFAVDTSYDVDTNTVQKSLEFRIRDKNTGMLSLNRTFIYPIFIGKVILDMAFKGFTFTSGMSWLKGILGIFAGIVSVFALAMILVNYVMALVDFFALMCFGTLMIPLGLFSGTKGYLASMLEGVGKITVKLLIIVSFVYVNISSTVNILLAIYESSENNDTIIDMYLSVILLSVILFVLSKQTSAIAGFLSGGQPQLSWGEFVNASASTAGAGAMASAPARSMAKTAGNVAGNGILSGMPHASQASQEASKAVRESGGSKAQQVMAGLGAGGKELAKSVGSSAKNHAVRGAVNAPGSLANSAKNFKSNAGQILTGNNSGFSAESFAGGEAFNGGGGSSGGGSSSEGNNEHPFKNSDGTFKGNTFGQRAGNAYKDLSSRINKGESIGGVMKENLDNLKVSESKLNPKMGSVSQSAMDNAKNESKEN